MIIRQGFFRLPRLQFSLRFLLAAIAVTAVMSAWLASRIDQKNEERAAIARLKRRGAKILYDWQLGDKRAAGPPGGKWIGKVLGDDFFAKVAVIDANKCAIRDSDLTDLKELKGLEELYLYRADVTDAGIAYLRELVGLRWISLMGTRVTDAGVAELQAALPNCTIVRPRPGSTARPASQRQTR